MTSPAITVRREASYAEVAHLLLDCNVDGLPVVNENGDLIGMVTETDLIFKEAFGSGVPSNDLVARGRDSVRSMLKARAGTADELMSWPVVTAQLDEPLDAVARRMIDSGRAHLPVVEHGRVVGVIAEHDILRKFGRPSRAIAVDANRLLRDSTDVSAHLVMVEVEANVVTLSGSVTETAHIGLLAALMLTVDGVLAVDNQLVVA